MDSQKQRALESCNKVLDLLLDISMTQDLSTGESNALENDRVAIQTLLRIIIEANSSDKYRDA